jgi:hypothetical protein
MIKQAYSREKRNPSVAPKKKDMLQEALSSYHRQTMTEYVATLDPERLRHSTTKHNVALKYHALSRNPRIEENISTESRKRLNHTIKQDQFKLLFSLLKT